MVAVVLPDLKGVVTPRAIGLYRTDGHRVASETIDPMTTATVPGASSNVLSDAYVFGGGDLLARSYAAATKSPMPEWIVIDSATLGRLVGERDLEIRLDVPVEVFDGTKLSSFTTGTVGVTASELPKLMDGVAFLAPGERASVRRQLSSAALIGLSRSSSPLQLGVRTSMQPAQIERWLEGLSSSAVP